MLATKYVRVHGKCTLHLISYRLLLTHSLSSARIEKKGSRWHEQTQHLLTASCLTCSIKDYMLVLHELKCVSLSAFLYLQAYETHQRSLQS